MLHEYNWTHTHGSKNGFSNNNACTIAIRTFGWKHFASANFKLPNGYSGGIPTTHTHTHTHVRTVVLDLVLDLSTFTQNNLLYAFSFSLLNMLLSSICACIPNSSLGLCHLFTPFHIRVRGNTVYFFHSSPIHSFILCSLAYNRRLIVLNLNGIRTAHIQLWVWVWVYFTPVFFYHLKIHNLFVCRLYKFWCR